MEGFHLCLLLHFLLLVCFSVDKLLINLFLFLVFISLALSLPSFKHKSSGRQRSQWFSESENHCKLPWLYAAGLGWSNCPAEEKETAIFPYPLVPLPTMGIHHCTQWEHLLIWYSHVSWAFLPGIQVYSHETDGSINILHIPSIKARYYQLPITSDSDCMQTCQWNCVMQLFDTYLLLG